MTKRRRYVGLRAVRDAIFAGETETRATAHLVTERLDEGPILCLSEPFPVSPLVRDALSWGAADILKAYAYAHQEWMIRSAWGPILSVAIASVAVRELERFIYAQ
jgi:methionyl-tRNA formyltransferase